MGKQHSKQAPLPKIFAPWLWQRSLHMRLGFYKTPRLGDCSLWDGGGLCVLGNRFNCHTPGYFDDWEEGWSLERWDELRWFQLFWGGCGPVTPVAVCLVVMVSYGSDSSQSSFRGIYGFLANTWKVPFKKKWIICLESLGDYLANGLWAGRCVFCFRFRICASFGWFFCSQAGICGRSFGVWGMETSAPIRRVFTPKTLKDHSCHHHGLGRWRCRRGFGEGGNRSTRASWIPRPELNVALGEEWGAP